ncbi:site-specific tyrosine recombinase XerD [Candidatus Termititenax aidoneus]|uniref:Site-specific tyrosine recombinase XerD n=1 Tax=Termititenax aidoneus TaxID=2218524 RepID=A0A388T832_TERA1|nr:site-specific tyrosine recombinase XerD [Candidatus Termititenax aidoneus]
MAMNELQLFNAYMTGKGWKEITKYTYRTIVKKFVELCPDYQGFDAEKAKNFIFKTRETKSRKTTKQMLIALRAFYNCLGLNAAIWKYRIVPERKIPKHLTKEEVDRLLNKMDGKDIYSVRDKAMYELIYAGGLKTTEVIRLKMADVEIPKRRLWLGRKRAYFGKLAAAALIEYIGRRSEFLPKVDNLFVNAQGIEISPQRVELRLKKYAVAAGVPENAVTPQALRNSLAVHLFDGGADAKTVQKIMRHRRANHIGRYAETSEICRGEVEMLDYENMQ